MSTTGGGLPAGVATLIFDVLGTVVDEAGSVAAATARALAAVGAGTAQADYVATEWTRRVETLTGQVAAVRHRGGRTTRCGGIRSWRRSAPPGRAGCRRPWLVISPCPLIRLTRAYKPDPSVYRMALDLLGLDPRHTMMIAAHPWDLRAAAGHGMRTGYIARPGEGTPAPDDRFDVYATDLADLAQRLMRDTGPAR